MEFYYFMLKRYQSNLQQAKCIVRFLAMVLPILVFVIFIRTVSATAFHSLLFLTGWCTWTFVEYILHRFWMHNQDSNSSMAQTHHHHHTHPTEIIVTNVHRVSMIAIVATLAVVAGYLNDYFTLFVGFSFGLAGYFLMHRFLHLKIGQKVFKRLVRYHIYHHCKYPNTCFGISVPWWDDLFKTVPVTPKITPRIIDFYFKGHDHSAPRETSHITGRTQACGHDCRSCKVGEKSCSE